MTKYALLGAALLATALASPATAQQVISEPGYCAQFYPNANCQNKGLSNPYTDGGYYRNSNWQNGNALMGHRQPGHHRMHRGFKSGDFGRRE
jgi:hypothetical protein